MFLRRIRRKKHGENYDYWALVECVRTEYGLRQRVVATIGKLPDLKEEERVGWEEIERILNGEPKCERDLFEEGMVNEENLDFLRKRGAKYIVGTTRDAREEF